LALEGGEDYVLLFTLPPDLAPPPELGGRRIGTITPRGRKDRVFIVHDGVRRRLPDAGWDHLSEG
jgi:thiamine monophosphate kinase